MTALLAARSLGRSHFSPPVLAESARWGPWDWLGRHSVAKQPALVVNRRRPSGGQNDASWFFSTVGPRSSIHGT